MDNSNSKISIDDYGTKTYTNLKEDLHRLDGPALEYANGDKFWYKEGRWHRENSPAIEWINGSKEWYKEGLCHRIDGPAEEWANGEKYWYILRKPLEEKEFNSWMIRIQKFI